MNRAVQSPRDGGAIRGPSIDRPLAALSALAGIGAIAVSSCCALPLALAAAGIGAGWLGDLEAFSVYRPVILGLAGVALAVAWMAFVRRTPAPACVADGVCAAAPRRWLTPGMLVLATAVFALGVA
jgi:mercuric ion transport protein